MVRTRSEEHELRDVEATVAILITEELLAQHELGAHDVPVPECLTCRAHTPPADPRLPF